MQFLLIITLPKLFLSRYTLRCISNIVYALFRKFWVWSIIGFQDNTITVDFGFILKLGLTFLVALMDGVRFMMINIGQTESYFPLRPDWQDLVEIVAQAQTCHNVWCWLISYRFVELSVTSERRITRYSKEMSPAGNKLCAMQGRLEFMNTISLDELYSQNPILIKILQSDSSLTTYQICYFVSRLHFLCCSIQNSNRSVVSVCCIRCLLDFWIKLE